MKRIPLGIFISIGCLSLSFGQVVGMTKPQTAPITGKFCSAGNSTRPKEKNFQLTEAVAKKIAVKESPVFQEITIKQSLPFKEFLLDIISGEMIENTKSSHSISHKNEFCTTVTGKLNYESTKKEAERLLIDFKTRVVLEDMNQFRKNENKEPVIQITLNHPTGKYQPGETLQLDIVAKQDVYLILEYCNSEAKVVRLVPNPQIPRGFLKANTQYQVPDSEGYPQFLIRLQPPFGENFLMAYVLNRPKNLIQEENCKISAEAFRDAVITVAENPKAGFVDVVPVPLTIDSASIRFQNSQISPFANQPGDSIQAQPETKP